MSKIREDLAGVVTVHVAGVPTTLRAGDHVPRGAKVDPDLLEAGSGDEAPAYTPEPLSDEELAYVDESGVGSYVDPEVRPDFVRGYRAGYADGSSAAVQTVVSEGKADESNDDRGVTVHGQPSQPVEVDYDPADDDVDGVLAELEKRDPEERRAILAKEAAGKGRVGVLQSRYADDAGT